MYRPILFAASLSIALALVASRAYAQDTEPASTIRVMGEATVTSRPDRVEIELGVVTRATTSQQAATDNARALQNVLASLRSTLGERADIETISYTLQPDYQYSQNAPPRITGYTATNVVRVRQDDLTRIGAVLDAATRAGANQIERIRFTLKDESAAKAKALDLAAADARVKAYSLARSLGLQVVRIRSVEETSQTPRPFYNLEMAKVATAATPILPGAIETTARVSFVVEIGNQRR